jgi:hypothetical protein
VEVLSKVWEIGGWRTSICCKIPTHTNGGCRPESNRYSSEAVICGGNVTRPTTKYVRLSDSCSLVWGICRCICWRGRVRHHIHVLEVRIEMVMTKGMVLSSPGMMWHIWAAVEARAGTVTTESECIISAVESAISQCALFYLRARLLRAKLWKSTHVSDKLQATQKKSPFLPSRWGV